MSSLASVQEQIDQVNRELNNIDLQTSDAPDTPERARLRKREAELTVLLSTLRQEEKKKLRELSAGPLTPAPRPGQPTPVPLASSGGLNLAQENALQRILTQREQDVRELQAQLREERGKRAAAILAETAGYSARQSRADNRIAELEQALNAIRIDQQSSSGSESDAVRVARADLARKAVEADELQHRVERLTREIEASAASGRSAGAEQEKRLADLQARLETANRLAEQLRIDQRSSSGSESDAVRVARADLARKAGEASDAIARADELQRRVDHLTREIEASDASGRLVGAEVRVARADLARKAGEASDAIARADELQRRVDHLTREIEASAASGRLAGAEQEQRLADLQARLETANRLAERLVVLADQDERRRVHTEYIAASLDSRAAERVAAATAAAARAEAARAKDASNASKAAAALLAARVAAETAAANAERERRAAEESRLREQQLQQDRNSSSSDDGDIIQSEDNSSGVPRSFLRRGFEALTGAIGGAMFANDEAAAAEAQRGAEEARRAAAAAASLSVPSNSGEFQSLTPQPLSPTSGTPLSIVIGTEGSFTWVRRDIDGKLGFELSVTADRLGRQMFNGLTLASDGVSYDDGVVNFYTSPIAMTTLIERIVAPMIQLWYEADTASIINDNSLYVNTVEPLLFLVALAIDRARAAQGVDVQRTDLEDAFAFVQRVAEWLLIKGLTKSEATNGPNDKFRAQDDNAINDAAVQLFANLPIVGATIRQIQTKTDTRGNVIRGRAKGSRQNPNIATLPPIINGLDKAPSAFGDPDEDPPQYVALLVAGSQQNDERVREFVKTYNSAQSSSANRISQEQEQRALAASQEWRTIRPTLFDVPRTQVDARALVNGVSGKKDAYLFRIFGDVYERTFMLNIFQLAASRKGIVLIQPPFAILAPSNPLAILPKLFPVLVPAGGDATNFAPALRAVTNDGISPVQVAAAATAAGAGASGAQKIVLNAYARDTSLALPHFASEIVQVLEEKNNAKSRQALAGIIAYGLFLPLEFDAQGGAQSLFDRFGRRPNFVRTGSTVPTLTSEQVAQTTVKSASNAARGMVAEQATTVNQESIFDRVRKMSTVIRNDKRVHANAIAWLDAAGKPADGIKREQKSTLALIDESESPHSVTVFVPTNRLFALSEQTFKQAGVAAKGSIGRAASYFVVRGNVDVKKTLTTEFSRFHTASADPIEIRKLSSEGDIIEIEYSGPLRVVFKSDKTKNGYFYLVDLVRDVSSGHSVTPPDLDWTAALANTKPAENLRDDKIGRPNVRDSDTDDIYQPLPDVDATRRAQLPPPLFFSEQKAIVLSTCHGVSAAYVDEMTILYRAIERAGLHDVLFDEGSGRFTIFAPTTQALVDARIDTLSRQQLGELLKYHVVRGDFDEQRVKSLMREADVLRTLADEQLRFIDGPTPKRASLEGKLFAGDLVRGDEKLIAARGKRHSIRVHFINRVLEPPATIQSRCGYLPNRGGLAADSGLLRYNDRNETVRQYLENVLSLARQEGLLTASNAASPKTLLLPTRAALFDAIASNNNSDAAYIRRLLDFHTLPGTYDAETIYALAGGAEVRTTNTGETLQFVSGRPKAPLAGKLFTGDLQSTDNRLGAGLLVHTIDRVLQPLTSSGGGVDDNGFAFSTNRTRPVSDPNVVVLELALKRAGLEKKVFAGGPLSVTIFAPSAQALEAAGVGAMSDAALAEVLKYHVVVGDITADKVSDLANRMSSRPTLSGDSVTFSKNLQPLPGYIDTSDLTADSDHKIKNGRNVPIRVHFIRRVLTPPIFSQAKRQANISPVAAAAVAAPQAVAATTTTSTSKQQATSTNAAAETLATTTIVSEHRNKAAEQLSDEVIAFQKQRALTMRALSMATSGDDAEAAVLRLSEAFAKVKVNDIPTQLPNWTRDIEAVRSSLVQNAQLGMVGKRAAHAEINRLQGLVTPTR